MSIRPTEIGRKHYVRGFAGDQSEVSSADRRAAPPGPARRGFGSLHPADRVLHQEPRRCRSPTPISLILTAAAQRPDGIAAPPTNLPPAPRAAVAKALLRAGLLVPTVKEHDDVGATWKLDGAMVVLRITETGLWATGVEQQGMPAPLGNAVSEVADAVAAALTTDAATTRPANRRSESLEGSGAQCVVGADQLADAVHGPCQEPDGALPQSGLRNAARAVLAA